MHEWVSVQLFLVKCSMSVCGIWIRMCDVMTFLLQYAPWIEIVMLQQRHTKNLKLLCASTFVVTVCGRNTCSWPYSTYIYIYTCIFIYFHLWVECVVIQGHPNRLTDLLTLQGSIRVNLHCITHYTQYRPYAMVGGILIIIITAQLSRRNKVGTHFYLHRDIYKVNDLMIMA